MSIVLKVTPQKLRTTAEEFNAKNENIRTCTGEMISQITQISGDVWSGDAATAYISKFKGLQENIDLMCTRLKTQASNLETIAMEYESAESSNESLASGLASSIIS